MTERTYEKVKKLLDAALNLYKKEGQENIEVENNMHFILRTIFRFDAHEQEIIDTIRQLKWGSVTIHIQNGEVKTIEKKETFKVGE